MIGLLFCQKNIFLLGTAFSPKGLRCPPGITVLALEEQRTAITAGCIVNLVLIKVNVSNGNCFIISIRCRLIVFETISNPLESANRRQARQVADLGIPDQFWCLFALIALRIRAKDSRELQVPLCNVWEFLEVNEFAYNLYLNESEAEGFSDS